MTDLFRVLIQDWHVPTMLATAFMVSAGIAIFAGILTWRDNRRGWE